jgi:predicted nuclease of predicted toxin-antitoxin system
MRGLVDAQLPMALARSLSVLGHDVVHVTDVGLTAASDRRIWDFAVTEHRAIITKDEDFSARRAVAPSGPFVVWIRLGNLRKRALIEHVLRVWPAIVAAEERGEALVEVT